MVINPNSLIIGITGSFGSGCTTLANQLKINFGFSGVSLSHEVRRIAVNRGIVIDSPGSRTELQNIGDELRENEGNDYLAQLSEDRLAERFPNAERYCIDGIRNFSEVEYYSKYKNFFLLAIDCSADERFRRLVQNGTYRKTPEDRDLFDSQDERDGASRSQHGQQVKNCVDRADILFLNEKPLEPKASLVRLLKGTLTRLGIIDVAAEAQLFEILCKRLAPYIRLLRGESPFRKANPKETMMSLASTLALQSSCMKRQVGAVLCDEVGNLLSAGWNDVPRNQVPCQEMNNRCYREQCKEEERNLLLQL